MGCFWRLLGFNGKVLLSFVDIDIAKQQCRRVVVGFGHPQLRLVVACFTYSSYKEKDIYHPIKALALTLIFSELIHVELGCLRSGTIKTDVQTLTSCNGFTWTICPTRASGP